MAYAHDQELDRKQRSRRKDDPHDLTPWSYATAKRAQRITGVVPNYQQNAQPYHVDPGLRTSPIANMNMPQQQYDQYQAQTQYYGGNAMQSNANMNMPQQPQYPAQRPYYGGNTMQSNANMNMPQQRQYAAHVQTPYYGANAMQSPDYYDFNRPYEESSSSSGDYNANNEQSSSSESFRGIGMVFFTFIYCIILLGGSGLTFYYYKKFVDDSESSSGDAYDSHIHVSKETTAAKIPCSIYNVGLDRYEWEATNDAAKDLLKSSNIHLERVQIRFDQSKSSFLSFEVFTQSEESNGIPKVHAHGEFIGLNNHGECVGNIEWTETPTIDGQIRIRKKDVTTFRIEHKNKNRAGSETVYDFAKWEDDADENKIECSVENLEVDTMEWHEDKKARFDESGGDNDKMWKLTDGDDIYQGSFQSMPCPSNELPDEIKSEHEEDAKWCKGIDTSSKHITLWVESVYYPLNVYVYDHEEKEVILELVQYEPECTVVYLQLAADGKLFTNGDGQISQYKFEATTENAWKMENTIGEDPKRSFSGKFAAGTIDSKDVPNLPDDATPGQYCQSATTDSESPAPNIHLTLYIKQESQIKKFYMYYDDPEDPDPDDAMIPWSIYTPPRRRRVIESSAEHSIFFSPSLSAMVMVVIVIGLQTHYSYLR